MLDVWGISIDAPSAALFERLPHCLDMTAGAAGKAGPAQASLFGGCDGDLWIIALAAPPSMGLALETRRAIEFAGRLGGTLGRPASPRGCPTAAT